MNEKKINRIRRGKRTRLNIRESGKASLVVNKTPRHIYAQIISGEGDRVLASASTLQEEIRFYGVGVFRQGDLGGETAYSRPFCQ